jgi:hypothetical protein
VWVVQSILAFAPGDVDRFWSALPANAESCRAELRPSGRELFGGVKQWVRIRNESVDYNLERFSCCVTPLPTDAEEPHDIVYIRDGDVILLIYGTDVEWVARHAQDRLDGIPSKD